MLGVKGVICRMLSLIFGSSNTDALGCDRSGQPQTQGISILRPGKPIVSVMLHITPLKGLKHFIVVMVNRKAKVGANSVHCIDTGHKSRRAELGCASRKTHYHFF